jgi:hypothetical protein
MHITAKVQLLPSSLPPRTRFVVFGGALIETFLLSADNVAVSKLSRGMADRSDIFLQFVLKAYVVIGY